jgi:hypothetical protein
MNVDIVNDFNQAETVFYTEHATHLRTLKERAKATRILIAKCKRVIELETLTKELLPPQGVDVVDIDALEKALANLSLLHQTDLHIELRELTADLDNTKTDVEALADKVLNINILRSHRNKLLFYPDNHTATVAANAKVLCCKLLAEIEEHEQKLTRYNQDHVRIHVLVFTICRLKQKTDLKSKLELHATYATAAEFLRAVKFVSLPECPICMSTDPSNAFCDTACKHTFHRSCIGAWLNKHTTCPMCRAVIDVNRLISK